MNFPVMLIAEDICGRWLGLCRYADVGIDLAPLVCPRIRSTRAIDTGRRTSGTSAPTYSPCATDTGKQGELGLCRYLRIGIGLAVVHRCLQLLASLENSSAEL